MHIYTDNRRCCRPIRDRAAIFFCDLFSTLGGGLDSILIWHEEAEEYGVDGDRYWYFCALACHGINNC